jgi:hypothetical protein
VKEEAARKAGREMSAIEKRKKKWQYYFDGDGVVMKASIHDAILEESLPYTEDLNLNYYSDYNCSYGTIDFARNWRHG